MKKVLPWGFVAAVIVLIADFGIMGLKIMDGDYDIEALAYVALVGTWVVGGCAVYRVFARRCPCCGKRRTTNGDYCPYCGEKISQE